MTIQAVFERGRHAAEAIPYSLIALAARVAAGGVFWRSGQTKLDGFHVADTTFYLFQEEYRLPLIPPDIAAYLATINENLFSALLVVGLASRVSAAVLLGMTAVIQLFVFPEAWSEHILWAASLLVIIQRGPGRISLDHAVVRFWAMAPDPYAKDLRVQRD